MLEHEKNQTGTNAMAVRMEMSREKNHKIFLKLLR